MRLFDDDIDNVNHMIDEIEDDIDRAARRIESCVDRLDELALKVARASKVLREQVMQQQANSAAHKPTTTH
jgi:archaellum component FlaC